MAEQTAVLSSQTAVIGALLIAPEICGELFGETAPEDFVTAAYRNVYEAARGLFFEGKAVDAVTVLDRLGGGAETRKFLMGLMEVTPSAANWREYAALLREQARLYRLRQIGGELGLAETLTQARALLERAEAEGSDTGRRSAVSVQDGLVSFFRRMGEPVSYVQFGIGALDRALFAGMGDFIVIGGRPSAGKTLLSIQMASVLAREYRVGYFSLETGKEKFFDRFFTQACLLDFDRVKRHALTPQEYETITFMKQRLTRLHIDMIPAGGYTAADIQSETLAGRYQVIFVDYLQLVRSDGGRAGNRTEEVGAVSRALHTLAQRHNILVIALAQLSRGMPGRAFAEPTLQDLRESGQIEQDADVVGLLHVLPSGADGRTCPDDDRLLNVAKNKEGRLCRIQLAFHGAHQQFLERMSATYTGQTGPKRPFPTAPAMQAAPDPQLSLDGSKLPPRA